MRKRAVAIAGIVVASFAGAAPAAAFQPLDLRVDGGEETWHAEPSFSLRWRNPAGGEHAVAAIHYRLLDPSGQVALAERRIGWPAASIEGLRVPSVPGAYTAEVWLEADNRETGAPVPAKLRFDNTPPGHVEPLPSPGWIGRNAFPYVLRLGHPAGSEPLSGIRGYAISIDRFSSGMPCAGVHTCTELETDLRGGAEMDLLTVESLPEGTSFVHAVAVSGSGKRSAVAGTTLLRVDKTDPVTQLTGIPSGWSNRPLALMAKAFDPGSGMAVTGTGATPFTAIRIDGGTPISAAGDSVAGTVIASGIHTVAYYARDLAGNVPDGALANGQPNHAAAVAIARIDREAPNLAFANAQDPRDPERIEARASDPLSGLDRGQISVRRAGSTDRFEELSTELRDGLLWARWDSDAYPAGQYEFRASVRDLAGNESTTLSRANGSPMSIRSPLKISTRLLAGFGDSALHTVSYGHGATVSGRLIAGRRAGLSGMSTQVIERFDEGARLSERVSTVRTGPGGGFSLDLASGPSRQIVVVAPSTATLRAASSEALRLAVRSGVRLRSSAAVAKVGGRPVVFRGKLAGGADIPAAGIAVQLQFRLPGLPWSEFRTIRTDQHGRFRYPYRFADDDSRGVRFLFRAYVPAQADWPFEPAGSRQVAIRGS